MVDYWSFHGVGPGRLWFGRGALGRVSIEATDHRWNRLLIIADRNLETAGLVAKLTTALDTGGAKQNDRCYELFLEGEAEPSIAVADAASQAAREFRPDAIVALGGGSNMDVAKYVAIVAAHGGTPSDYFGIDQVPGPICPLIAIPTTSGTGSEVSHAAVLTDTENAIKISCLSQHLRPAIAVVDPSLTDGCPRQVTADSGIDALTHAVEAKTNTPFDRLEIPPDQVRSYQGSHPLGALLADRAIELVGRFLDRAVNQPGDTEARDQMALASTLAGMAFSNCGVALVHALEYPLGGKYHCSHGAGNGLLLPYVMEFNRPTCEPRMAQIGRLLNQDAIRQGQLDLDDDAVAAAQAIESVRKLREKIGIPDRLREMGAQSEDLDALAAKSFAISRLMLYNARRPTLEDLQQLLHRAL